jgi:alcohol dehydrogenase class IV
MSARFAFPTSITFGPGAVAELANLLQELGARRSLVVTDALMKETAAYQSAVASVGGEFAVFAETQSNPGEADVRAATRAFLENSCDAVIGLGGGCVLYVAKLVRACAKRPQWNVREPLAANDALGALAPLIAVPTTAGTGSEVGRSSVITIDGQKHVIFHASLLAERVILDPQLTVGLPAKLTAATGADALTHCIESFTSPVFHPPCDGIAIEGIHLIARSLRRAVREPTNLDARGDMLIAAMMGGIAFQKDLGAAHSLAHPLSAICGVHHGLANALVLPAVMRFNAIRKPGLYERVGQAMGLHSATTPRTIDAVEDLFKDIGLPRGLGRVGVKPDHLPALADQAYSDSCHQTNPVPVTRDDLLQLYREAMA